MILRTDIATLLERNIRTGFLGGMSQYTPLRQAFCDETGSDGASEFYGDMGAVPWPQQNGGQNPGTGTDPRTGDQRVGGLHEGQNITVLGGQDRGLQVFNRDWDIPIGISHSAIDDAQVGDLEAWARTAGTRFEQHKDYLAFSALNNGAGSTHGYCYDGLPFFSASHKDPGAIYQTVQSNTNALALSPTTFDQVYVAGSKFKDDKGIFMGVSHNLLVHATDLRKMAAQIADNPFEAGTADRDINPYNGDIRRLSAPGGWLDTTAWYLVSDQPGMKPLGMQIRQAPQLVVWDDHSQGAGVRYFKWTARYEVFYRDWRACVQGNT